MKKLRAGEPSDYLSSDAVVDHEHPDVARLAGRLREGRRNDRAFAKAAFELSGTTSGTPGPPRTPA